MRLKTFGICATLKALYVAEKSNIFSASAKTVEYATKIEPHMRLKTFGICATLKALYVAERSNIFSAYAIFCRMYASHIRQLKFRVMRIFRLCMDTLTEDSER